MAKGALLILLAEVLAIVSHYLAKSTPKRIQDFRVPDWVTFVVSVVLASAGFLTSVYVFVE